MHSLQAVGTSYADVYVLVICGEFVTGVMTHRFLWQPVCTSNEISLLGGRWQLYVLLYLLFCFRVYELLRDRQRGKYVFLKILLTTDTQKSTPFLATQWCT